MNERIQQYTKHLEDNFLARNAGNTFSAVAVPGRKFVKIVCVNSSNTFAHSFIVQQDTGKFKAGDILKAAGWRQPAMNFARGNINNPDSYQHITWAGH